MLDRIGCKFVIVRFYPNLARDEFLNVGVILHADPQNSGQIEARFLQRFGELKLFVPEQDRYILEGLKFMLRNLDRELESESKDENFLLQFSERFQHHLRFSEIRATLAVDPVQRVEELYDLYVSIESRERVTSGQITRKQIKSHFLYAFEKFGVRERIKKDVTVEGKYFKTHSFDFQYETDNIRYLLYAVSFDLQNTDYAIEQVKALRGGAEDILERGNNISIIAALYPPKKDLDVFDNSKSFLEKAKCDVRNLKSEPEESIVEKLIQTSQIATRFNI